LDTSVHEGCQEEIGLETGHSILVADLVVDFSAKYRMGAFEL
jgi:hypothetical protein